jgi:hypothetical protein
VEEDEKQKEVEEEVKKVKVEALHHSYSLTPLPYCRVKLCVV